MRGVVAALKAKYGLPAQEAEEQLTTLERNPRTPLREHALKVKRLVDLAYPLCLDGYREDMILDTFMNTLGDADLEVYLDYEVETSSSEQAIREGDKYLEEGKRTPSAAETFLSQVQNLPEHWFEGIPGDIRESVEQLKEALARSGGPVSSQEKPSTQGKEDQERTNSSPAEAMLKGNCDPVEYNCGVGEPTSDSREPPLALPPPRTVTPPVGLGPPMCSSPLPAQEERMWEKASSKEPSAHTSGERTKTHTHLRYRLPWLQPVIGRQTQELRGTFRVLPQRFRSF